MQTDKTTIDKLVEGCKQGNRSAQRKLFQQFFSYGMKICLRYAANREEAEEMLSDGFFRVLTKIGQYDSAYPFLPWLKTVLINTAINYNRRKKGFLTETLDNVTTAAVVVHNEVLDNLALEDLIRLVQQLSPAYRTVFSLAVIEGYKHHEIAALLNITVGTSKSNLAKAKKKLKGLIKELHQTKMT